MHRGGYQLYKGAYYQKGYGLGGTFRRLFSWIIPIVQKHAFPAIKEGLREVGKTAINTAADIAKDSIQGRDIKEAAQDRVSTAIDELKERVENKLVGKGIKRRRKTKHSKRSLKNKKRKKQRTKKILLLKKPSDIFD